MRIQHRKFLDCDLERLWIACHEDTRGSIGSERFGDREANAA